VLMITLEDLTDEDRDVRRRARRWFLSPRVGIGSSRWVAEQLNLTHSCLVKEIANRRPAPRSRQLELAL
jgi:hypothetical protein